MQQGAIRRTDGPLYFDSPRGAIPVNTDIVPFNLVFLGNKVVLFPRRVEKELTWPQFPLTKHGGIELGGKIIIVDPKSYADCDAAKVESALRETTLSYEEMAKLGIFNLF